MARRAAVLVAAWAGLAADDVARWGIGTRDAALFDLRMHLFGAEADALATCPGCGDRLELRLDLRALRPRPVADHDALLAVGGYGVQHRPPNTDDLVAIAGLASDPAAARAALLDRAIESLRGPDGRAVALADLDDADREQVAAAVTTAQDGADVRLELACVVCDRAWVAPFDIGAFLLREVDAWARRLLGEVHALARSYGWTEGEVLDLSARRRRAYLDLVGA